ncbi:MAG: Rrf2 family transcriptional regulator [Phycisphaerales bacterium]|nr:Rrf2 family transcriptional regulator [Phycisphaerales bacterium]
MLRRKTATYALLAIYEIAQQQTESSVSSGVRAGDIAHKHKLPKAYAAKILSQLANVGILRSDRGPRGGFRLNRTPDEISLFDVFDGVGAISTFDKKDDAVKGMPPTVQAVLSKAHQDAAAKLKDLFVQTSLNEVLGNGQKD